MADVFGVEKTTRKARQTISQFGKQQGRQS